MTLNPSSSTENFKRSLDTYLATVCAGIPSTAPLLPDVTSLQVNMEGFEGFEDISLAEWVQPHLGEVVPQMYTSRDIDLAGTRAQSVAIMYNLAIFVRGRSQTLAHRLQQLRDALLQAYREHVKIPVLDYASGANTALGNLVVDRLMTDRNTTEPVQADVVLAWTLTFTLRWVALY